MQLERIVSGGQSGADRAALDVALALGVPCGGWCPKGRRAEDGALDPRYPLVETPSSTYALRTEWNVRDSDATLILSTDEPTRGTGLTQRFAAEYGRPCLIVNPFGPTSAERVAGWIIEHRIRVLNIAGPRETEHPGIYDAAAALLRRILSPGSAHHAP